MSSPVRVDDQIGKTSTAASPTTSPSSTFAGSSANSLPISDITASDDRGDPTKIPFAYSRRQPTQAPCPPRYPPRPSPPSSPAHPAVSEPKRPRSVRALLVPRPVLDDDDPPRRTLPRDNSYDDSEEASSVWFATSNSSPSLRYSSKSLASNSGKTIQHSSSLIEATHHQSSPTMSPSASLRRIAAAAVAAAEARTSARRKSRREKASATSASSRLPVPDVPRPKSPFARLSLSKSAGPITRSTLSSAGPSRSSLPTQRGGVIFSSRRNIGFADWEELEEDSRRHLHMPRGLVETLPKSKPTRLPRTRVFIQKSSNPRDVSQSAGKLSLSSVGNSSKEHLLASQTSSLTNNSANFESIPEPNSSSGDSESSAIEHRPQRVSSVTIASDAEEANVEGETTAEIEGEGEKQTPDIFSDDLSSRFLSFSKADFRRQIRSAVDAFRSTGTPQEGDEEVSAVQSTSPERTGRSRRCIRTSLASSNGLPRPLTAMSDLDDDDSDDDWEDEDDTVPVVKKTASSRFPDRPRLNRRLGMMASGKIISGSSSKKSRKNSESEEGGHHGIAHLGKVARRLFKASLQLGKSPKSPAIPEEIATAPDPEPVTPGHALMTRDETRSYPTTSPISGDAATQASDVYIAFMRDAAEREAQLHLKDVCLPTKVIARASLKVKGRRPAPTSPFVNIEGREKVEPSRLQ